MDEREGKPMGNVIHIDEARIRGHPGEMVRGTVEEALNGMLDAEADRLCGADRYQRSAARKAADLLEERIEETLTFYAFPDSHWIKLRTNNPLERLMKEIRRRTKVVGAFPDGKSCLNLAAARLRHVAGTEWSTRRYMNMQPLHEMKLQPPGAAVA